MLNLSRKFSFLLLTTSAFSLFNISLVLLKINWVLDYINPNTLNWNSLLHFKHQQNGKVEVSRVEKTHRFTDLTMFNPSSLELNSE